MGCGKVIGSAGSDEKCALLLEMGFDAAFNYKKESAADALAREAPGGVDIYFDNVGGAILDDTLLHMRSFGRIIACGSISLYNTPRDQLYGVKNVFTVTTRQLKMQGFLVSTWQAEFPAATAQLAAWMREGKLKNRDTVVTGFSKLPAAFVAMFKGENVGKMVVDVSAP
jgi:NADPH-dependent curcumin reductase CurA